MWPENSSKPIRGGPGEAGECVKQEGAGKANSVRECPEEAPCLVLGPSSPPSVVPTLLVPTLAARVAGAPQNREGSRFVTMSAGGRCCEFLRPCCSEGCLTARASVRCPAARAGLGPLPALPVGRAVTFVEKAPSRTRCHQPRTSGQPRLSHEGHRTAGRPLGDMAPPPPHPPSRYTASPPPSNQPKQQPGARPSFSQAHGDMRTYITPNLKFQAVDTHSKLFTE